MLHGQCVAEITYNMTSHDLMLTTVLMGLHYEEGWARGQG